MTEPRLAACRKNLQKAVEWHRTSRTPNYAPGFRHGCQADLERSLEMAGEKREDYDAHRELFQQAFHPRDAGERNLVEGAAQAVWRRLRALRAHQMAELLRLCVLLGSLQAGTLAQRRQRFREEVKVALGGAVMLWEPMKKLHQRMEHIFRALVEAETHKFRFVGRRCERMERAMRGWAPEVIGNPYRQAPILERHEAWVRPVEEWREWGTGARSASWAEPELGRMGQAPSYPLRQALTEQAQELGQGPLPQDLDAFTRLVESALGEGEEARKLAELVWERVTLFQRRAEQEAEELEGLLSEAAASEMTPEARRELAVKVLSLMVEGDKSLDEAEELGRRIERAAEDLEAGRPVDITPPTPAERLQGKSVNELIGLLLQNELEERLGKQRSVVEAMEAVRRQEEEKKKPRAGKQESEVRSQKPETRPDQS